MRNRNLLEKIKRNLARIKSKKHGNSELELIIKCSDRDRVARELGRIGTVRFVFDMIPYITLVCSPEDAEKLSKTYYGIENDSATSKLISYSLSNYIQSIELSNQVKCSSFISKVTDFFLEEICEDMWNLENIGAPLAQEHTTGKGVRVAVIDTGIDYNHNELSSNFGPEKGINLIIHDEEPMDDNGHGTHVAGTISGEEVGIATDSILYAVKVLDSYGFGSEAGVIAGIEWAMSKRVDLINMSLGSEDASSAFEDICRLASRQGIVMVAAAGNEGYGACYPASFDSVISAAAVDRYNKHAEFSNIDDTVDISAPGVEVYSTYLNNRYRRLTGTSMATPHVTGSLALAFSLSKNFDIKEMFEETSQRLYYDGHYDDEWVFGKGLVRIDRIVGKLSKYKKIKKLLRYYS